MQQSAVDKGGETRNGERALANVCDPTRHRAPATASASGGGVFRFLFTWEVREVGAAAHHLIEDLHRELAVPAVAELQDEARAQLIPISELRPPQVQEHAACVIDPHPHVPDGLAAAGFSELDIMEGKPVKIIYQEAGEHQPPSKPLPHDAEELEAHQVRHVLLLGLRGGDGRVGTPIVTPPKILNGENTTFPFTQNLSQPKTCIFQIVMHSNLE